MTETKVFTPTDLETISLLSFLKHRRKQDEAELTNVALPVAASAAPDGAKQDNSSFVVAEKQL